MANKILAAILSLIIPGLGQLYGGQGIVKSIIFFVIFLILLGVAGFVIPYAGILSIILAIYAAYDAYTLTE